MSTLIAYATKHGMTEICAQELKKGLSGTIELVNLKSGKPDLKKYDTVILGTSIYMGQPRKEMKEFIAANQAVLATKKLGLFLCCMQEAAQAQGQLQAAFPETLRTAAKAQGVLGGGFLFDKMGFMEKFIVKKMAGATENTIKMNKEAIAAFAQAMA